MTIKKIKTNGAAELRQRAEQIAQGKTTLSQKCLKALSQEEIQQMFHELYLHQIELELQNEELRQKQLDLESSRDHFFNFFDLSAVGYFTLSEDGLIHRSQSHGS